MSIYPASLATDFPAGYEILGHLGGGGQADVYKAVHAPTGRIVAIKRTRSSSERERVRLRREMEALVRVDHPGIVQVFDCGEAGGATFIVLEFVQGLPIDDFALARLTTVEDTVRLFLQVLRAVTAAHQHGVLHRDLHPQNILVTAEGVVKVLDFGLARQDTVDPDCPAPPRITSTGQIFGTLPYLSPEQARGQRQIMDVRSDLYSLGIVLFELLTGRIPYPIETDPVTMISHIVATPPARLSRAVGWSNNLLRVPSPGREKELATIIEMALRKDPRERYASAATFHDDLAAWLEGNPVRARGMRPAYLLRKAAAKYRGLLATAGTLMALVLFGGVAIANAWTVARTQRDNARQATTALHATLHGVITEVDDAVQSLAGGTTSRVRILQVLGSQFDAVRPLLEHDDYLQPLLPEFLERQGDLSEAQGDQTRAGTYYAEALDQLGASAASASPSTIRLHRKLARCSIDPEPYLREALRHDAAGGGDPGAAIEWARAASALAYHCVQIDRVWEADNLLSQADRALQGASGGATALLRAEMDECRGEVLAAQAEPDRALEALERASEAYVTAAAAHPERAAIRHRKVRVLLRQAQLLLELNRGPEAEAALRLALEDGQYLVTVDPSMWDWRRDCVGAAYRLAELRLNRGDAEAALTIASSAAAQIKGGRDSDRLELQGYLNDLVGRCFLSCGQPSTALESFEFAAAALRALAEMRPEWPAAKRQLAATLLRTSAAHRELGDAEREQQSLCSALAVLAAGDSEPATPKDRVQTVAALVNLATSYRSSGLNDAARSAVEQARALLDEAAQAGDPRLRDEIRMLGAALNRQQQILEGRRAPASN